jgi:MFS family permease
MLAVYQPARQSIIAQLVPAEELLNAVALNTTAINLMRIVGPAVAGVLLFSGVGSVYLLSGALSILVIVAISLIEIRHEPRAADVEASWLGDIREGLGFVSRNPTVLSVLGLALILFTFGLPYQSVFVPLFAKKVLDLGDSGVAALGVVTGAGALAGSLVLASQTRLPRRGLLLLAFLALFSLGLMVFSRSTLLPLSIVTLMAAASMSPSYMTLTNMLLLELSPPNMRGRVMSLMSLDRGFVPVGAATAGALAATLGPQDGLLVMAGVCLTLTVLAALVVPALRRI